MKYGNKKTIFLISLLFYAPIFMAAQSPHPNINPDISTSKLDSLYRQWGLNKKIPALYERQILTALSFFPELKNTRILFRIQHAHSPLATRPSYYSVIKPASHRIYIITISDSSIDMLSTILFHQLPFNAQVGVIGHELSHATDFSRMRSTQLIALAINHISTKYIDKFEYRTDSICIAHGLGFQLLSWSIFVRTTLHRKMWEGPDNLHPTNPNEERYMNPGTIIRHMRASSLYRSFEIIQQ